MKNKKGTDIRNIAALQSEIKEEIASKWRHIDEIKKEIAKLTQSLQGYHKMRLLVESNWNEKICAFIREHEPNTTSNLAEATTTNIVYELRRRGFDGLLTRIDDETGDCESYDIQKEFKHEDDGDKETVHD